MGENTTIATVGDNVTFPSISITYIFVIFACVVEGILMVLTCLTNGTVLVVYIRTQSLHTTTNYFIVQMAVADLSVGFWMPLHIILFLQPYLLQHMTLCTLRYASLLLSLGVSIYSLLAMTYDRLYAIKHPLHYHAQMTTKRYILLAIVVWAWPLGFSSAVMIWHNPWEDIPSRVCDMVLVLPLEYTRFLLLPQFLGISFLMVAMYVAIFRIAHKQASSNPHQFQTNSTASSRLQREMKMIKTGLIVFCTFYLCWVPLTVLTLYQVSHTHVLTNTTLNTLRLASVFLVVLQSVLNPLVYAFRLPLYRTFFYKLLPCRNSRVHNLDI